MKRLKLFAAALSISLSSVFVVAMPRALAATTRTWDGGGSDSKISTAANWSTDVAPVAGDSLVFPANVSSRTVANDLAANTSFANITFTGATTMDSNYTITGNAVTLTGGITNNMTGSNSTGQIVDLPITLNGSQTFESGTSYLSMGGAISLGSNALTVNTNVEAFVSLKGIMSGSGSLTMTGTGTMTLEGDNTYTGATTVSSGFLAVMHHNGLGASSAGTTVASGAVLGFAETSGDVSYAEPLTLAGTGTSTQPTLTLARGFFGGAASDGAFPLSTLSGALTLQSDITVGAFDRNVKITGAITGSHAITLDGDSTGSVEIASSANGSSTANSTLTIGAKETKYEDDSSSTNITVHPNETAIVTGTYGDVTVASSGTLKGTGTVGVTSVTGTIAPGLSPGCLTTGDLGLQPASTYAFELGGKTACTQYDQIKANGTVTIGGALSISIVNGFKPVVGQKYVIISNDGSDAVSGAFSDLAQGDTVKVGTYSFSISYKGGDGNDVELTVTAGVPATGFNLLQSNPVVTASVMLGSGAAILLIARRGKLAGRHR